VEWPFLGAIMEEFIVINWTVLLQCKARNTAKAL